MEPQCGKGLAVGVGFPMSSLSLLWPVSSAGPVSTLVLCRPRTCTDLYLQSVNGLVCDDFPSSDAGRGIGASGELDHPWSLSVVWISWPVLASLCRVFVGL